MKRECCSTTMAKANEVIIFSESNHNNELDNNENCNGDTS